VLGLGETDADRQETLKAIAQSHQRWGHIQEVILQPYRPGHQDDWSMVGFAVEELVEIVAIARDLLPSDITIQIPPNLVESPQHLLACIDAGARDLGGIVPLDHVNPDYGHGAIAQLSQSLNPQGWTLQPRLPIYPRFDTWLPESLHQAVQSWQKFLDPMVGQK